MRWRIRTGLKGIKRAILRAGASALVIALFACATPAQTYRGAINGSVLDPSGAVVPNAQVKAKEKSTGIEHGTISTTDGQFAFQDLQVGKYTIIVTATGFPVLTIDNILVSQGVVYTLPVKLTLSHEATTIEVSAAALSLDTTSEAQTTLIT